MKRYLSLFIALVCVAMCAFSAQKLYINPGHGSYTSDSRPMGTIAYPLKSNGMPDTLGFYESNTNMWKALYLKEKLDATGKYSIKMSRMKSGGSQNGTYNKALSTIASEAANWGGYFLSIHSNAHTEGSTVNYLLLIHRGYNNSATNSGSIPFEKALWKRLFDINDKGMEYYSSYSMTNMNIKGGLSMNGWDYGVLKHSRPGTLAEGYFHTYQPARHRALNPDWCCQEGLRYFRGIQDYFGYGTESKGYIMGYVRTKEKSLDQTYYKKANCKKNDVYAPINGAKIVLRDANGNVIKTNCYPYVKRMKKDQSYYTTDGNYNGVFVFQNLAPGKYTIYVHASGYKDYTKELTVSKDQTTYHEVFMTSGSGTSPNVGSIDPDIEWVLNGGIVPGGTVPSNDALKADFMTAYNKYFGQSIATTREFSNFLYYGNSIGCDISKMLADSKSGWAWLGDYIEEVSAAANFTLDTETKWRYSVVAFMTCGAASANNADYTTAGKSSKWGNAYCVAHGTSAELPTSVTATYTLPTPIKEGFKFVGWFENKEGTGTALTSIPAKYKGTLYAIWTAKDPEVIWELNGGKVAEAVKVPTNDSLWNAFKPYYNTYYGLNRADQPITGVATFANAKMYDIMTNSKSEYKWLGDYISTAALGLGVELESDETRWRWHVHCFFNCNDGTIQGDQKVATADFTEAGKPEAWGPAYQAKYGAGVTLPQFITSTYALPTPTKSGYKFVGWYNNNEGTGEALTTLPVGYKGTVYAIWQEAVDADVHWILNGGTVSGTLPDKIETEYTIPTPTKSGFIFLGWYDNAAGSGAALTKLPVGYKGNVYAIWKEPKVTWVLNGGKVYEMKTTTSDVKVPTQDELWISFKTAADITALGTLAEIKAAGEGKPHDDGNNPCACRIICQKLTDTKAQAILTNTSWTWLKDYILTIQTDLPTDLSGTAWKYAVAAFFLQSQHSKWPVSADFSTAGKPEKWGPAYQKAHGGVTTTEKVEVTLPTKITAEYTIPTPEREGVTFIGWFNDEYGQGEQLVKLPVGYDGTVYAIWSDNQISADVKWVLNGGTTLETLPAIINAEFTLPTPTKTGYVFLGWYDNAEGTGSALTTLPVGYKGTIYALWREAKVTWVLNGGKVLEEVIVSGGSNVKVPTNEELWNDFKVYFNKYYNLSRPDKPITEVSAFWLYSGIDEEAKVLTNANSEYKWLGDYILKVSTAQGYVIDSEGAWRWSLHHFFNCSQRTETHLPTADFSTAGKPEAWGPAYQAAHGSGTSTEWKEVTLPSSITGNDYLIPTPTKEGDTFIGWYDNNEGIGEALTVLPVGYDGTVYAIWKSTGTATNAEQIIRTAFDVNAPMYDIMGRQVDETYRGIIIQNGNKYLLR